MLSLFQKLAPFVDQIRQAPDDVKSAWFDLLIRVMEEGWVQKKVIFAGWYQTDKGLELFQLPELPSPQENEDPPIYRVTILPLPQIRQYNTSYLVELSQTIMNTSLFPPERADIDVQRIEIMIHDISTPQNSCKYILERKRHLTKPVWQQHQVTDDTGQILSFVPFAHLKGIVDTAIAAAGLSPPQPTTLDHLRHNRQSPSLSI